MKEQELISNLTFAEFEKIWCKYGFLDESGSLGNKLEMFFTIGLLKLTQPYYLQSAIRYLRNIHKFYDEMKFNKISKNNIDFLKRVLDTLFEIPGISFYGYTTHKNSEYFRNNFANNEWQAYEKITLKVLGHAVADLETLNLIADHIVTPKEIKYETKVKSQFNRSRGRLALTGVLRIDSKANDLLQVVDLLIGAITYDLKLSNKLVSGDKNKIDFLNYFKAKLGCVDFSQGFNNHNFKIFVERENII